MTATLRTKTIVQTSEYTKNNDDRSIPRRSERSRKVPDRYGTWDSKAHFALSANSLWKTTH